MEKLGTYSVMEFSGGMQDVEHPRDLDEVRGPSSFCRQVLTAYTAEI
jgi:hypothetical protein